MHGQSLLLLLQVAASVVQDFDEDNVKYLELRTTPRANPNTGFSLSSLPFAI